MEAVAPPPSIWRYFAAPETPQACRGSFDRKPSIFLMKPTKPAATYPSGKASFTPNSTAEHTPRKPQRKRETENAKCFCGTQNFCAPQPTAAQKNILQKN